MGFVHCSGAFQVTYNYGTSIHVPTCTKCKYLYFCSIVEGLVSLTLLLCLVIVSLRGREGATQGGGGRRQKRGDRGGKKRGSIQEGGGGGEG